ncbi:MAG: Pirin, partial [uncultured Acidimicrobiales bacterium]
RLQQGSDATASTDHPPGHLGQCCPPAAPARGHPYPARGERRVQRSSVVLEGPAPGRHQPLREERRLAPRRRQSPERGRPLHPDVGAARRSCHQVWLRAARNRRRAPLRRSRHHRLRHPQAHRRLRHPHQQPMRRRVEGATTCL